MAQQTKYDWDKLYDEFKSSGLTKVDFCKQKKIPEGTLYKGFIRVEKQRNGEKTLSTTSVEAPVFAKVKLMTDEISEKQTPIMLQFSNFSIYVDESTDLNLLSKIVQAISDKC